MKSQKLDAAEKSSLPDAAIWLAPSELRPWSGNPRDNALAVPRVAALITRFGFGAPIVARSANREIIAGHTRHLAALQLGLARVPVRLLDISEADAHQLALADNRQAELTPWNDAELLAQLSALDMADASLLGWDAQQLDTLRQQAESALAEASSDTPSASAADESDGSELSVSLECTKPALLYDALVAELHNTTHAQHTALPLSAIAVQLNQCAKGGKPRITLADRWFPHRYDVLAGTSPCTPNASLRDETIIRNAAELCRELDKWPTVTAVLGAISIYHGRQCARQFPIHVARDLYREHAHAGARVLDPCAGWGGRLLGWLCSLQGGVYHGFDASAETVRGHERMITELRIRNARVKHAAFEDAQVRRDAYDLVFTSPPYFDVERYSDDAEQSYKRYATYPAWRDGFLTALIGKSLAALKPRGALILNVSDAGKHRIAHDAQLIAQAHGGTLEHSGELDVGAGSGGQMNTSAAIKEDLLIIRKGD